MSSLVDPLRLQSCVPEAGEVCVETGLNASRFSFFLHTSSYVLHNRVYQFSDFSMHFAFALDKIEKFCYFPSKAAKWWLTSWCSKCYRGQVVHPWITTIYNILSTYTCIVHCPAQDFTAAYRLPQLPTTSVVMLDKYMRRPVAEQQIFGLSVKYNFGPTGKKQPIFSYIFITL